MMQKVPSGSFIAALAALHAKGVRYATVIDIGCADGHFFLSAQAMGVAADAAPLNIDANRLYEPSLREIQDVFGGQYFIGAVTDRQGPIEMTVSRHPYWSSLRPPEDSYWDRVNNLAEGKVQVDADTLDALVARFQARPPFLLKLDVQGAEADVLRGARQTLEDASVVVCEADVDDFSAIDRVMAEAGFGIFDLTEIARLGDGSVGWFYPVYLNRKLDHLRQRAFWDETKDDEVIAQQKARRTAILEQNAKLLAKERQRRQGPKT